MSDGVLDWFWGIIEGDFNEDPSAGQIIIGIIIGFIPIVGTIADIRDVCANLRQISKDKTNTLAWIALVATIIAFIPGAGEFLLHLLPVALVHPLEERFKRQRGGDGRAAGLVA